MGYTHVTVTVSNLQKSKPPYTASFLVDTGAVVCLAPATELRKAGIEPEGREAYELANGTPVEYDYGFARLSFMGSDTVTKIIFGPDGVEPLLGVTALESVGIGVDPVSQTLKRYAALPLKKVETVLQGSGTILRATPRRAA
jgi:clan AA aspartic protease